eukprot:Protomagalhaensia_wolfi_Nauph_80__2824@NODE_2933_length_939_cov_19_947778_g2303_i0_p1_GENE_NODE_2933_length_939_cov_19_947778_g2303_i0NODE_2933_length_939_cov_19_947778_g2303_i0_p1_ORF_typecomplete_len273_score21_44_NODE_2933_length_939_cov_19_947778_g2303_i020838
MTFRAVRSREESTSIVTNSGVAAFCVLTAGKDSFYGGHPMQNVTGPFSNNASDSNLNKDHSDIEWRQNGRLQPYPDFAHCRRSGDRSKFNDCSSTQEEMIDRSYGDASQVSQAGHAPNYFGVSSHLPGSQVHKKARSSGFGMTLPYKDHDDTPSREVDKLTASAPSLEACVTTTSEPLFNQTRMSQASHSGWNKIPLHQGASSTRTLESSSSKPEPFPPTPLSSTKRPNKKEAVGVWALVAGMWTNAQGDALPDTESQKLTEALENARRHKF